MPWLSAALTALGLLGGAGHVAAQQAPATIRLSPEDAQRRGGGHQHNFYFLPPGQGGEDYQSAGFFGQRLRPYLAGHEEALASLNHYRRQKSLFLADRLVAVGSLVFYGVKVFEKDKFPQYDSDAQIVAGGFFVGSLLTTLFINRNTNQYLQRAVESYNAGKSHGSRWLRPTGLGLGAVQGHPTLALSWTLR